jgi:ATP-dependent phosphofructokinase / diphosphate-dependent phosphofructokinase
MAKRVGVLTGGGDCPGLNPAIRGCVYRGLDHGFEFVGLAEGWKGLVEGNTVPLGLEQVEDIIGRGGTILGTSRTNPFKREGGVDKCLQTWEELGLDALVAMGGEDTLGVATRLFQEHQLSVVGVPKTMDNDLSATDFTFGFDTSVTVAVEAAARLADTGRSHRRVMVLEVMGRHAGWVALYTGIASGADWTLLPEEPVVDVPRMCEHLKKVYARKKFALVVASEGITVPGFDSGEEETDEFGHMILRSRGVATQLTEVIERETGIETRNAVIGHIQRGGAPTLFDRMLGTRVGVEAADMIAAGKFGHMAALRGNDVIAVSLEEATGELKTVPKQWMELAQVFSK